MNSEEGTSLVKMAVTVLLVILVIAAVLGLVYAAYSWFGQGADKLSDNVSSISDTALSQYDDATVSGDDVLAALKNFRNSDYTVIICNLANQNKTFSQSADSVNGYAYCAKPDGFKEDTNSGNALTGKVTKKDVGTSGSQWTVPSILTVKDNAAAVDKNTNFTPTTTKAYGSTFVKKSAQWYANLVYDENTGDVCGVLFRQMG